MDPFLSCQTIDLSVRLVLFLARPRLIWEWPEERSVPGCENDLSHQFSSIVNSQQTEMLDVPGVYARVTVSPADEEKTLPQILPTLPTVELAGWPTVKRLVVGSAVCFSAWGI